MRERAEAATEGPWVAEVIGSEGWHVFGPPGANHPTRPKLRPRTAAVTWGSWQSDKADAEHIASWHPAVALAVADWLMAVSRRADDIAGTLLGSSDELRHRVIAANVAGYEPALAVADAYLGSDA